MRRIVSILLVALVATGALFAASSGNLVGDGAVASLTADFDLTLDLGSGTEVGWFEAEPTVANWGTGSVTKLTEDQDKAFDAFDSTVELWAGVKSNEAAQIKLEVSGEPLASAGGSVDTTIGIHAAGTGVDGTAQIEWDGTGSDTLSKTETGIVASARVIAAKIVFSMDAEDYNNALSADDYTADITLTVTSQS